MAGPPASRALRATAAARAPPALLPPTPTRPGSMSSSGACDDRPLEPGEAVVDGGGVGVLGREAVVDRHHDARGLRRVAQAAELLGVLVTEDEGTAVEEHQGRPRTGSGGPPERRSGLGSRLRRRGRGSSGSRR